MDILLMILYFIVMLAATIGVLFLGRKFVFSKVRINKYIPLAIAIGLFILQVLLPSIVGEVAFWMSAIMTILVVTFFLWFMDIHNTGGPKAKEKQIEIRSKAKPNRAKQYKIQEEKKKGSV